MTASSKHPPNWRLWHHSQGINFQQPLYPTIDVARFVTEASTFKESDTDSSAATTASVRMESEVTQEASSVARRGEKDDAMPGGAAVETIRTTLEASSVEDVQGATREDADSRGPEKPNNVSSPQPDAQPEVDKHPADNSHPPFTPLEYKMSKDSFQAAKAAEEGSAESYWSYSFYRGPNEADDVNGKVRVHYCKSAHTAERALQYFLNEKFLGLDLEWVADSNKYSGARRNVSLVQLASQSRVVLLHLALYPGKDVLATPTLRKILEDPQITKLGVWIKGDCTRLRNYLGIESRSIFELSHLFKQVKYSASGQIELINKKFVSLANQVRDIMGLPMKKDQNVRASDWSQPLSLEQIGYAASDAYAAVQLFAVLNHKREMLDPVPALPFYADLGKPIPLPPGVESSSDEASLEDEATDEAEIEAPEVSAKGDGKKIDELRLEVLQVLRDVRENLGGLELGGDDSQLPDTSNIGTKVAKRRAAAAAKAPPPPKDAKIQAAETWLAEHKEARGEKPAVGPAALRAYHIWHNNPELGAEGVAQLLNVQVATVAVYVMSSVHAEDLPYNTYRMKKELFSCLPGDKVRKRYSTVWKAVNSFHDRWGKKKVGDWDLRL